MGVLKNKKCEKYHYESKKEEFSAKNKAYFLAI
jgi:hypothetical protein